MPTISTRADPGAAADAASNPGVNAAPTPKREAEWVQQFAVRLKANAQWLKRFLHGGN